MPNDKFQASSDSLIAPASQCFTITPNDSLSLEQITKAVYVGNGGDVTLRACDSAQDVTFSNVPTGAILDVRVAAVRSTGTTASAIVGLA